MKFINYLFFRTKLLSVCVLVFSAAIQSTCFAEKLHFTIATPINPPFYYLDDQNNPQGVILELFSLVETQADIKIDVLPMPWARALTEVKSGNINALLGARHSKEREEDLFFPNTPFINFKTLLFKRTDNDIDLNDVNNPLSELSIAAVRSMQLNEYFYDIMAQGKNNVVEVVDFNSAIKMLNFERVDLVVGIDYFGQFLIRQMGLEKEISVMTYLEDQTPAYIAFSKEYASQYNVNEIMLKIKHVIASEIFQKQLKENWLIENWESIKE
ncbi:MAG: polar amino acid transport system substrate-binding protein [Paraglaciecola sp.]|jgi:polar amino acid transport system substrate-binding protein